MSTWLVLFGLDLLRVFPACRYVFVLWLCSLVGFVYRGCFAGFGFAFDFWFLVFGCLGWLLVVWCFGVRSWRLGLCDGFSGF